MALTTTDLCVIRLDKGESISAELTGILDELDIASIQSFTVPPERPTELHYHDFDEYWLFTEGSTTVTLRLPDGTKVAVGNEEIIDRNCPPAEPTQSRRTPLPAKTPEPAPVAEDPGSKPPAERTVEAPAPKPASTDESGKKKRRRGRRRKKKDSRKG